MPAAGMLKLEDPGDAYRPTPDRRKVKIETLEAQVQQLEQQLKAAQLERVHEQAQLDALSEYAAGASCAQQQLRNVRESAQRHPSLTERALCPHDAPVSVLDFSLEGELDDEGAEAIASLMASMRGAGAPNTTPETCRNVTPGFLADVYLECKVRTYELLKVGAEVEGSPAAAALDWHILQCRKVWLHAWAVSPVFFNAYFYSVIVRGTSPEASANWRERLEVMELDAAQQEVLAFEATAMLNRLQCISERQQRLLAQLCSPAAAPSGVHPNPELMTRMHECVGEVQDMLGAAYHAFLGVLRPLQQARGSVTSGCVLTDVIVIGMRLAAQQGEALATERMSTCPSGGMCDVLDWLMGDAASSRGGPLSQDGSDAGDLDSLGLDGSSPSGGFCAGIEPRAVGPAEPVSS